ncbi:Myb-like DNA-binding domain containing protein [Trichomonas vaginalis G3]|uniref:Myb-like DNA-binding domain containing protein n=1 Tax=Trichomonas vaginalis (strain ATCC PRA-98 / G3) TaxID=412133 RepID=A2DBM4_TRIV3|nr:RNA polymerase II transcription regulator recruiting protein [Trichomonas vaginalis G3]EAY22227.1 Myb-like DNA-binding domain containing protein [Trichomonas vaginalis G3]KAI5533315.1 RNA polymerase II transcription regulator recruiting protein [Trichomonas vaginalis G3]|eukprot:XP_001583213.1 Myb-like DNA-binding domain containing protein [Trichomonas vaginalis G3]
MNDIETFKPLLAVGMQYIREVAPRASAEDLNRIKVVFDDFIEGKVSHDDAVNSFKEIIGTIHPLEKINAVLQVDDTPIPPPSETSNQFSSLYNYQNQSRKKTHPWTELEDQRLLSGIHKFGLDNWAAVCAHVGNARTRAQCSQRWFRGLDPRISKVLWTPEEDAKLIELVEKHGDRCWTKIAAELGNRSDAQCRYHYRQLTKEKDDDNSVGFIPNGGKLNPVYSAPNSQFKQQLQPLVPSQSLLTITNFPRKIPPIDSFVEDIQKLPRHLRFDFPAMPVLAPQPPVQPEETGL